MKKADIELLFNTSPLKSNRTIIKPIDELDTETFLLNSLQNIDITDDKIRKKYKENLLQNLSDDSYIVFHVRLIENSEYIGFIEIRDIDSKPEIGIDILKNHQRQGYGFEIAQSLIDYIFLNTAISVLTYRCYSNNIASIKLANKLGAVKTGVNRHFTHAKNNSKEVATSGNDFNIIEHEIRKQH